MSKTILLKNNNFAIVDEDDYEQIKNFKWRVTDSGKGSLYVKGFISGLHIYLHRYLMKAEKGDVVDHINGNPFDNRKENLRVCKHFENIRNNRKPNRKCKSAFKGLTLKSNGQWWVRIQIAGRAISIGSYIDEVEAAKAYDKAAIEHHGQFARLNFPNQ